MTDYSNLLSRRRLMEMAVAVPLVGAATPTVAQEVKRRYTPNEILVLYCPMQ
jgi:hypothetical protein